MVDIPLCRPLVNSECNNLLLLLKLGSSAKSSTINKIWNNLFVSFFPFDILLPLNAILLFELNFLRRNGRNKMVVRLLFL